MARITEALLRDILQAVGGAQNIAACGHCMTRLRLTLNQPGESDLARLKSLPGVLGVIDSEAQLQIVLGPGKAQNRRRGDAETCWLRVIPRWHRRAKQRNFACWRSGRSSS